MLAYGFIGLFAVLFTGIVLCHSRLKWRIVRMEHWKTIKQTHLARLNMDWNGIPHPQEAMTAENHPYAYDMDIVGPYSLLRLLDTTISTRGYRHLSSALLAPDLSSDLDHRQKLVLELVPRSLLRDKIILAAKMIASHGHLQSEEIVDAIKTPQNFAGLKRVFILETGLAILTAIFFVMEHLFNGPYFWPYSFGVYAVIYLFYVDRLAPVFDKTLTLRSQLERLAPLLEYLETRRHLNAPALHTLCAPFRHVGTRPSVLLRKIALVCDGLSVKAHPLVHLIVNSVSPWDFYFVYKYERILATLLPVMDPWLDTLGQIEMIGAIAQFSALHPEYCLPRIDKKCEGLMVAKNIGHPLIPASKRIVNNFSLNGLGSIKLITGSNMSGKSTFLRTVGINLCLAQAGAPVCADSFSAPRMRIYCSLRIKDDLEMGLSYFYAEVKRLKQLLNAATDQSSPPILFLIDEIFKGTNNRERIIGSQSYLKALVKSHGMGLVTTHDLELTALADENPRISNYYFQESIRDGHLAFDYRLHEGICSETNALRIMALEGLPVEQKGDTTGRPYRPFVI